MNDRTGDMLNTALVRDYRCAQCWGVLVELWKDERYVPRIAGSGEPSGGYVVECPRHCQPGGFVTAAFAERRQAESAAELAKVAANYPALDPRPQPSAEARQAQAAALFGEE
jgi:hypothetical protein